MPGSRTSPSPSPTSRSALPSALCRHYGLVPQQSNRSHRTLEEARRYLLPPVSRLALRPEVGRGQPMVGQILLIDAMRMEFRSVLVARDPACPTCGQEPTITELIDYEVFCGLANGGTNDASDVPEIEVEELKAALNADERLAILDVREPYEWEICNLGRRGARLIPESELVARLNEIDPKVQLVVHCHSGGRSTEAVEFLRQTGHTNVFNLRGDISAWAERIDAGMATY